MPVLPGLITITSGVHGDIDKTEDEHFDPAQLAKIWRGSTHVNRRFHDSGAERVENLMWRVWGSRGRPPKEITVLAIFNQINAGQTFVPLRGPGEEMPSNMKQRPAASTTALHRQNGRPNTNTSANGTQAPPPMPRSILKKTQGPSTTGPKPTARFISPHDSEDEPTGMESPNANVFVQPPSPSTESQESKSPEKQTSKKKTSFVASRGKKKRPVVVRRQSSRDSASSTERQEVQPSSSGRTPPSLIKENRKSQSISQENLSPSTKPVTKKRDSPRSSDESISKTHKLPTDVAATGDPGPSVQVRQVEKSQAPRATSEELEVQRALLAEANAQKNASRNQSQHHSSSRPLHSSLRSTSDGKLVAKAKSSSTVSLAPQQLNLDTSTHAMFQSLDKGKGKGKAREEEASTEEPFIFTKRPVGPIVGTPEASASSLSKSKSQLTLLLERDRAESSDKKGKERERMNGNRKRSA